MADVSVEMGEGPVATTPVFGTASPFWLRTCTISTEAGGGLTMLVSTTGLPVPSALQVTLEDVWM